MYMVRIIFGGLLVALAVSGCSTLGIGDGGEAPRAELPQWVKNPPSDTPSTLYGLGSGRTLEAAKNAALNDIAGKLNIWVASSSEASSSRYAGEASRSYSEDIETRIEDLKLNNYEIEKTTERRGTTTVLLRVGRQAVFRDTKNRLQDMDETLTRVFKKDEGSSLVRFAAYQKQLKTLEDASRLVRILGALRSDFRGKAYMDRYREYRRTVETMRDQLAFRVVPSENTRHLGQQLVSLLVGKGVKAETGASGGSGTGSIKIRDTVTREEVFNTNLVQLHIWVTVKDERGIQVAKAEFTESGNSPSGYDVALETANRKIRNHLKERGIFTALRLTD